MKTRKPRASTKSRTPRAKAGNIRAARTPAEEERDYRRVKRAIFRTLREKGLTEAEVKDFAKWMRDHGQ